MEDRELVELLADFICEEAHRDIQPQGPLSPTSIRIWAGLRTQEHIQDMPLPSERKIMIHRRVKAEVCGKLEQEYGSPILH